MKAPISPFDIPLIVDNIGQRLAKRDCAHCTLVSKSFYSLFNNPLWNTIDWMAKKKKLSEAGEQVLLRNGHRIRRLTVAETGINSLLQYLAGPASPCQNLVEFSFSVTDYHSNKLSRYGPIANVIKRNDRLKKCTIVIATHGNTAPDYEPFFQVLSSHLSLVGLTLSQSVTVNRRIYEDLLKNLPMTLQVLELDWGITMFDGEPDSVHAADWRDVYPNLRSLGLRVLKYTHEKVSKAVLPLIQRCPVLERIEIAHSTANVSDFLTAIFQDAQFSPTFSEISLIQSPILEEDWKGFMPAMRGHIKSLNMDSSPFMKYPISFCSALTSHWADTLESIRFHGVMIVESQEIELILTTCSILRVFSIRCYHHGSIIGLKAIYTGDTIDIREDWACLQIETLELRFVDGRRTMGAYLDGMDVNGEAISQFKQQEAWTVNGIERIYQQLGRLTKLKNLHIGWHADEMFKFKANLDMSIKSGLIHLQGLKDLQILDVSDIRHDNIGQQELEWMLENWPGLKRLGGLITKNNHLLNSARDVQESAQIKWLKHARPYIVVS